MFIDCNLFGVISDGEIEEIRRIIVDRPTQVKLNEHFSSLLVNSKILDKEKVIFDGRYKPESMEVLAIQNYDIKQEIIAAIQNPISEETVNRVAIDVPNLKSVFMGNVIDEEIVIVFQIIQKSQHIASEGFNLFQRRGTFESVGENGFTLSDRIDALYMGNDLVFPSYYFARQIFELADYYRIATDHDVQEFVEEDSIIVEDNERFHANADSWVRRKIALIKDSRVLELNTVASICEIARDYNVDIQTEDRSGRAKILLPNDKKKLKDVLKFLDEDIYKGPLTNQTYETNSKLIKGGL